MNDMIINAAQDPSCILAVTPDRGGSWWAALRPDTPRNFAEKPVTFTDSFTAQNEIETDDFTLSVDFTLSRKNANGTFNIGCMRCIYYDSTNGYQPCVNILESDGTTNWLYPAGTSHITGNISSIQVIKTSQNIRMIVYAHGGGTISDQTKPLPDGASVTTSSGNTNYPGNIFAASIRNDTTGETVWQASHDELYETNYPWPSANPDTTPGLSEAERVRLLTKTNVRTDRGVFEAADTSRRWDVTTQLRAASLLPECTIIVEADNPNGELATIISCAQRTNPMQGFFVIRTVDSTSVMFGYSGKNSSGVTTYPTRFIKCQGGKHVFAFVLDYSVLQLRIYIDGAEVDNRAMDTGLVAPPEFDETVKPVILGVTSSSDGLNSTTKISHCLIFDRALTAAEIAALCPTAN